MRFSWFARGLPLLLSGVAASALAQGLDDRVIQAAPIPGSAVRLLPAVPDVVGMDITSATKLVHDAGFEVKIKHLDYPVATAAPGEISAMTPPAGTRMSGGTVEIALPRAAIKLGIGGLSLQDTDRRTGFDLDEGRYEEFLRGADLVLRYYESTAKTDPSNGSTYYSGQGHYLEPIDGAVIAILSNSSAIGLHGLGDYYTLIECQVALKSARRERIPVDGGGTVCVITAKGTVGVLNFGGAGVNPLHTTTNFQFRYANFPGSYYKGLGRVTPRTTPAGPARTLCEAAADARGRNSPAAPGLERQCAAQQVRQAEQAPILAGLPDLAVRGEALASADPRSASLREQQAEGPKRTGFDIGMAAAENQTAPGPGKDRIRATLAAGEQAGFDVGVSFSLDRNRNAELAATGERIAGADPAAAAARERDPDGRYQLGFDIATAIFGDPALGAKGNTATGPGSLGIRDALSAASQRGFNDAVAYHLARTY